MTDTDQGATTTAGLSRSPEAGPPVPAEPQPAEPALGMPADATVVIMRIVAGIPMQVEVPVASLAAPQPAAAPAAVTPITIDPVTLEPLGAAAPAASPAAAPAQAAPAQAAAPAAARPIPRQRRPAVTTPAPADPEDPAPTPGDLPVRSDDTMVVPRLAPESLATAVIPVVAGESGDTAMIPKAVPGPEDTQDIPFLHGAVYGRPRRRGVTWPTALGRAPEVLALSASGVVLVALAYAGGRSGAAWAAAAFWAGQMLVFAPVVVRMLLGRMTGTVESFALAMGLAVIQYFQKWLYSPDQFRFPDELQHWAATRALMQSGRLFGPDKSLPVAVHFPGLEEMGAAFASLTGLSVTVAGPIVAGVAHLTFIGLLFLVVRSTGGTAGLAGTTCVIYATALHYLFFDSMYIYQTAALPFLMLAVWASRKWRSASRENLPYAVICLVAVSVTAVSHHVTAAITVLTLLLIGACEALFGRPRRWAPLALAGGGTLIVAAWFGLVATDVFGYLEPPARAMVSGVSSMLGGGGASGPSAPGSPMWELAIQALGLLGLFALFCRALLVSWRSTLPLDPWRAAVLVGAFTFFLATGARFVGAQGPELAGRASTFTYIPMAMVAAGVLHRWRPHLRAPARPAALRRLVHRALPIRTIVLPPVALGASLALLLMVGARVGGWPPSWEQLPGPHLVSGYERSVDGQGVNAALWMQDWLGTGNRVAADLTGITLASTYGGQDPVGEASQLYYDATWGLGDELLLQALGVDYLWVDDRLSRQLPVSGPYFQVDPLGGRHTTPIPVANLTKFDSVAGVNRVYDNGDIRIYDMRNG